MAGLLEGDPVKFEYIIKSQRIVPGDTIKLLPGTYAGDWIVQASLTGTEAKPIKFCPNIPGTVTIDGSLNILGSYVEFHDIDFTDTAIDREVDTPGVTCNYPGFKLVGCRIGNMRSSCVNWYGGGVGQILECVFDASEGHAIYTHNNGGGLRQIERCLFNTTPHYGLHIYSAGLNHLRDYQVLNTVHNAAVDVGGGLGLDDLIYNNNIHFGNHQYFGRYKVEGGVDERCAANDNIIIDSGAVIIADTSAFTCIDNLLYGTPPTLDVGAGWAVTEKPATLSYFIPFTLSARWAGIQVDYTTATGEFTADVVDL